MTLPTRSTRTGVGTGKVTKPNRKKAVGNFKNYTYLVRNVPPEEAKTALNNLLVKDVKDGIDSMEGLWWQNSQSKLVTSKLCEDHLEYSSFHIEKKRDATTAFA
jgi:hypothetical protein